MIVLLTGATGFMGRHLRDALVSAGHQVICAVRHAHDPPGCDGCIREIEADFSRDFSPTAWTPRLAGVDAVINAVGILREHGSQTFDAIHVRAAKALFAACVMTGVRRVIQISALGADVHAVSRYHLSKKEADDFLADQPLDWIIAQPSVIYGPGGRSARLFTLLASLPWIPVPGRGDQQIQPVHSDDVVAAIIALLEADELQRRRVALVGPESLRLRGFLARLRSAMGLGRARFVGVPMPLARLAARFGTLLRRGLLDTETLNMLVRGNVADPAAIRKLLGREPRAVEAFIPQGDAPAIRTWAKLQWLLALLRWSVAIVWIWTGIVSLGLYPVSDSYALLARVGVSGALAPVLLYGAAMLDLAFGVAIFVMRRRRLLWIVQALVMVLYTLIITIHLPEFWLHPYGPTLKNLPMLAAIWLLYELEPDGEDPPASR